MYKIGDRVRCKVVNSRLESSIVFDSIKSDDIRTYEIVGRYYNSGFVLYISDNLKGTWAMSADQLRAYGADEKWLNKNCAAILAEAIGGLAGPKKRCEVCYEE